MKIQLKRSNVLQSGAAKEPTASQLEYGELAINYSNSDPAIFLKDSNNNIIRISGVGNIADDGLTNVPAGTTPPTNPTPESGNLWYNSDEGRLYIYYVDANTSQWVDASPDSWDPTVMPVTTNPAAQTGTLDDRYVMENGDTMTGALLLDNAASASAPDLSFDGDTNTGIYSPGADQVAIATGGNGHVFIDSSGNVGIGGSAPNYSDHNTLSVFGAANTGAGFIQFTDTSGNADGAIFVDDGHLFINADYDNTSANSTIRFRVDGSSEKMRIDGSGLVGIGTSSPSSADVSANQLVVANTGSACGITIHSSSANTGNIFFADGTSGSAVAEGYVQYNHASNDLIFGTTNTEQVRIDSSGRLLVGTSTAGSTLTNTVELHSAGTTTAQPAFQAYSFPGTAANNCSYFQLFRSRGSSVGTNTIVASGDRLGMLRWSGANGTGYNAAAEIYAEVDGTPGASGDMPGRLVFATTPGGVGLNVEERMRIDSAGRVGVGISSPITTLHTKTTTADSYIITENSSGHKWVFGAIDATYAQAGGLYGVHTGLVVNVSGNVGIGSTNPVVNLHLNSSSSTTQRIQTSLSSGFNTIHFVNDTSQNAYVWQNGSVQGAYGGANALNIADYNGPIVFAASNTGTYAEKMRVLPTGGLTFNGDTAQLNALDDYEEGLFTPEVRGTNTPGTASYQHRHGQYVKVGHLVHIQIYMTWTGGTGTGNLEIHNLPFANNSANTAYSGVAVGYWHVIPLAANYYPQLFISYNNNFIHCYQGPVGGSTAGPVPYSASGGGLIVSATYRAV